MNSNYEVGQVKGRSLCSSTDIEKLMDCAQVYTRMGAKIYDNCFGQNIRCRS